jgi:hypothetical protein
VADKKRIIGKKWKAKEEEKRHKGSLTPPLKKMNSDVPSSYPCVDGVQWTGACMSAFLYQLTRLDRRAGFD